MRMDGHIGALAVSPVLPRDALAESNHRIANNLTLIAGMVRMHARTVAKAAEAIPAHKVGALLEEICARIEAIAHLHSLLANTGNTDSIDLAAYAREIARVVVSSLTDGQKAELTDVSIGECRVAPERALTVGLIVGELVTNAVKYAHPTGVPGKISVGCRPLDGSIIVEVVDDGIGLPENFDPAQGGGLGMRLVHSLCDQLKAKLVFFDSGVGLSVQVHVPEAYPLHDG